MKLAKALESYIATREAEDAADQTIRSHRSRMKKFVEWCENQGVTNCSKIDMKLLTEWKSHRGKDLKKASLKGQLSTLRCFVRHIENVGELPEGTHERIQLPKLNSGEGVRDEYIKAERAEEALRFLSKYEYADPPHVALLLAWRVGLRRGSIVAIDVSDVHLDEAYLELKHRPETGTPLKNGFNGERPVALRDETVEVLRNYLNDKRPTVYDDHDRCPLVTSGQGRLHPTTVTQYAYAYSRPCYLNKDCPHGENSLTCEAVSWNGSSKCPSSRSSHAWRRGSITHALREEIPVDVVSDRMNVDPKTIEKHYNQMTDVEKMEQRRDYFK